MLAQNNQPPNWSRLQSTNGAVLKAAVRDILWLHGFCSVAKQSPGDSLLISFQALLSLIRANGRAHSTIRGRPLRVTCRYRQCLKDRAVTRNNLLPK